jgi:hypothetical protein
MHGSVILFIRESLVGVLLDWRARTSSSIVVNQSIKSNFDRSTNRIRRPIVVQRRRTRCVDRSSSIVEFDRRRSFDRRRRSIERAIESSIVDDSNVERSTTTLNRSTIFTSRARISSSFALHTPFRKPGHRTFFHLRRHCTWLRVRTCPAISFQFMPPICFTASRSLSSSSGSHLRGGREGPDHRRPAWIPFLDVRQRLCPKC